LASGAKNTRTLLRIGVIAFLLLAIASPWWPEFLVEFMERSWVPILIALFFVDFELAIGQDDKAKQWHEEEMAQWEKANHSE